MGAGQLLVEDGWIGVKQLQIDNICIGVRQLCIYCIPLLLDHSILRTCACELGLLKYPRRVLHSSGSGQWQPQKIPEARSNMHEARSALSVPAPPCSGPADPAPTLLARPARSNAPLRSAPLCYAVLCCVAHGILKVLCSL